MGARCVRRAGDGLVQLRRTARGEDRPRAAELRVGLPGRRRRRVDIDQRLHAGHARSGVGDHRSAVRVPDEHDRPAYRLQEVRDVSRVGREVLDRIRDRAYADARALQHPHLAGPAGRVRPRAVDEHDRRGRIARLASPKPVDGGRRVLGRRCAGGGERDRDHHRGGDGDRGEQQGTAHASTMARRPTARERALRSPESDSRLRRFARPAHGRRRDRSADAPQTLIRTALVRWFGKVRWVRQFP